MACNDEALTTTVGADPERWPWAMAL